MKPYTWLIASQSDMATRVQMLGKEVIGWALLVLAILLFPIPVIPSVLLVAGLLALSSRYCWAANLLARARRVVPARIMPMNLPVDNVVVSELSV
jgi:Putative transmembrane protein (PGPGW)